MRLIEIAKNNKPGTYAAVEFDDDTVSAIQEFAKNHNIPNIVTPKKIHCTLLFSKKHLPNYKAQGKIDPPYEGTPTNFEVWQSQPDENGDRANCLVLMFDCDKLVDRHHKLMDEHDATFDYDEFKPHITVSYDIGDMEIDHLPKGTDIVDKMMINNEYSNDLDPNWAKSSTK